jgi:hypothetical protein
MFGSPIMFMSVEQGIFRFSLLLLYTNIDSLPTRTKLGTCCSEEATVGLLRQIYSSPFTSNYKGFRSFNWKSETMAPLVTVIDLLREYVVAPWQYMTYASIYSEQKYRASTLRYFSVYFSTTFIKPHILWVPGIISLAIRLTEVLNSQFIYYNRSP